VNSSGCNWQKTYRPTGKRGAVSSWQCHSTYSPSNSGENARTTVGTSWTSALARSDFHPFGPLKTTFWAKVSLMTELKRRCGSGFSAAGLDALVKRWDKCNSDFGGYVDKLMFSPSSNIIYFMFYIHLWTIYWLSHVCWVYYTMSNVKPVCLMLTRSTQNGMNYTKMCLLSLVWNTLQMICTFELLSDQRETEHERREFKCAVAPPRCINGR
jgi:hypothetical protein